MDVNNLEVEEDFGHRGNAPFGAEVVWMGTWNREQQKA